MTRSLAPLTSALALTDLTDQALRVRAVEAASTYDTDRLITLTQAYMLTSSRRHGQTSPRTLRVYALGVRTYVPWAQDNGVTLLRPGMRDGDRFVLHLQRTPKRSRGGGLLSPATVAGYVAGAAALYRGLRWAGATQASPFDDVQVPSDPTPGIVKNPPYRDEVEAALAVADAPLSALILLCAHSGLRISEALTVRAGDIEGAELVVHGKGGKVRRVPLGRRVREALARVEPGPEGALFGWTLHTARYRLKRAFEQSGHGATFRGFHAARKQSASRLYEITGDFTRVGLFLGHASVDTTRKYVQVRANDVSAAVEEF